MSRWSGRPRCSRRRCIVATAVGVLHLRTTPLRGVVSIRKLPDWLVRLVGLFDKEVRGQLFELGKIRRLSSAQTEREFGWSARPVEETILDTATSLEAVGALSGTPRI